MGAEPVEPLQLRLDPRTYVVFAGLASAGMLAAAHAFERFGGYEPCALCLTQREAHWMALASAIVGSVILAFRPELRKVVPALLAALFTAGAVVAIYHAGIEWKLWPLPAGCQAGGAATSEGLAEILRGDTVRFVECDEAAWTLGGVSMAGWNALVSLGLAGLGLFAASERGAPRSRRRTFA